MKRIIYLISILCVLVSIPKVNALDECSTSELKRLKELANNTEFKYEYEIVDDGMYDDLEIVSKNALYTITGYNLSGELKYKVVDRGELYFTTNNSVIKNFLNGSTVKIEIRAYTKNLCSGKLIKTVTIKLPYFNPLSLNEECNEYKNFKYCQEFGKFNLNHTEFLDELEKYKNGLDNGDNLGDDIKDENSSYLKYIVFILVILIILVMIIIFARRKRKKDVDL